MKRRRRMQEVPRIIVWSIFAVVLSWLFLGCGGEKAVDRSSGSDETAEESPVTGLKGAVGEPTKSSKTVGEGEIAVGALPEGFASDLLPLYPGANVERSAKQKGEYTVLQTSQDSEDEVYGFYRKFYEGKNWKTTSKITIAGRTVAGFSGPDKRVDMTLQNASAGGTFFSLVLVDE
jgi:hypothetical protein